MLCLEVISTLLLSACGALQSGMCENSAPQYPVPSLGQGNCGWFCTKNDLAGGGWKLKLTGYLSECGFGQYLL